MVWRKPRFTNDLARRSSYLITGVASDRCNPFESAGLANSLRNAPPRNDPLMTAGALRYAARDPIVPSRAREIECELDAPLISGGQYEERESESPDCHGIAGDGDAVICANQSYGLYSRHTRRL